MAISGRKEKILEAVVSSYIDSCEPISSMELREKYFPALSSATIRNELANLEDLGYLVQPHISSGRVPTAEGYRLYVDRLMPKRKLSRKELKIVRSYINDKISDMEEMVKSTAKVLSEITNLTALGMSSSTSEDTIESIKIVKLSSDEALFIIVTDRTVLKDAVATIAEHISEDYLRNAERFISQIFHGRKIKDAIQPERIAKQVRKEYEKVFNVVIKILKHYGDQDFAEIAIEGSSKLLSQPEFSDVNKAKAMLELLDAKQQLVPLLRQNDMNLSVKIAADDELMEGAPPCAIVTASYSSGGVNIGSAGVIGPIRMDYSKVISVLDYIGKTIASLPDKKEINEDDEQE
jgi:heat-inducible transcriptional repressor